MKTLKRIIIAILLLHIAPLIVMVLPGLEVDLIIRYLIGMIVNFFLFTGVMFITYIMWLMDNNN